MSAEIINKALLRARAERLQIQDPRVYANRIDVSQVIPVQEIDPVQPPLLPTSAEQTVSYDTEIVDISGLASYTAEIFPAQDGLHAVMLSLGFRFSGDADGSPSYVRFRVSYELPVGQQYAIIDSSKLFYTNGASAWSERFAMGGWSADMASPNPVVVGSWPWPGYIPPEVPIRITLDKSNTTVFPANCLLEWHRFATLWPVGTLRPF